MCSSHLPKNNLTQLIIKYTNISKLYGINKCGGILHAGTLSDHYYGYYN